MFSLSNFYKPYVLHSVKENINNTGFGYNGTEQFDLINICYTCTCTVKENPKWFSILLIWYELLSFFVVVKSDLTSTQEEDIWDINVDGSQRFRDKIIVRSSKTWLF